MTFIDLFWIFFMLSALQPVLRQSMLEAMRTRKIALLERKRGSRVILLVHRQETMRLLGFPLMRYIEVNDSEQVLRAVHMTDPDVPLDIVLHTPGGLVLAAIQIARAVRDHKAKVTVFVPHYVGGHADRIGSRRDCHVQTLRPLLDDFDQRCGWKLSDRPGQGGRARVSRAPAFARAGGNACGDAVDGTMDT
jgi:Serine dehydrogenase proteinase